MKRKCDRGHRLSVGDLKRGRCSVCESINPEWSKPGGTITASFAVLADHVIDLREVDAEPPPDDSQAVDITSIHGGQ